MTQQFTASEVRDLAKRGTDAMQQFIDGRHTLHIPPQHDDADMVIAECLRAMDAFADLLEAWEKAVPVAYAEFADNGCVRVWSRGYEERSPGTRMVPLYTHPSPADAERLAEALRRTCRKMKTFSRTGALDGAVAVWVDEIESVLAAHSVQAQPPAASVTDAMVEDGCMAWNKSAGLGYAVADRDCMRAAIEAALAAQENPNG